MFIDHYAVALANARRACYVFATFRLAPQPGQNWALLGFGRAARAMMLPPRILIHIWVSEMAVTGQKWSFAVLRLVEQTGWFSFFLLCTLLALPGMLLLQKVAPSNGDKFAEK